MRQDGSLALDRLPALIAHLRAQGVDGLFVAGTTGEGRQLTDDERRRLCDAVVGCAGDLPLIVHVGHDSVAAATTLAAHAAATGADAIAVSPPCYHRVTALDQLIACYEPVLAAAPTLPAYHYHIPCLSGCTVPPSELLAVAGDHLPTLRGVKFTHESLMELARCQAVDGERFTIGFGRDEQMLAALPYGIDWFIGSTFNVAASIYHALRAAFAAGDHDEARRQQERAIALVTCLQRHGGLAAIKAILTLQGCDCGPCRPPLARLDDRAVADIRHTLTTLDLLEGVTP